VWVIEKVAKATNEVDDGDMELCFVWCGVPCCSYFSIVFVLGVLLSTLFLFTYPAKAGLFGLVVSNSWSLIGGIHGKIQAQRQNTTS